MANVQFFKGTTVPTTSTLADGGIYFNTSNKLIYINNEGTLVSWDGNNSTVNDGKLTIIQNGDNKNPLGIFTANDSDDVTIDISVPTVVKGAKALVDSLINTEYPFYADSQNIPEQGSENIQPTGQILSEYKNMDGLSFFALQDSSTLTAGTLRGLTATVNDLNYLSGVTGNIQEQLDGKQATITGAATTITEDDLATSRALISNADGKIVVSEVTAEELKTLSGIEVTTSELNTLKGSDSTTTIQEQLNGKQATITGAATTITSSNLTALRALASDADGKVATMSVTAEQLYTLYNVEGNIQEQLDGKQATITGAATSITSSNLTASRALASNDEGKVATIEVTADELYTLHYVEGNIQEQLDGKSPTDHTHNSFTGATTTSEGKAGFVPAPPVDTNYSFLRGDGTWATFIGNPNLLVNGDFQIWQRGESFNFNSATLNTSFYTADRWYTTHSASYGGIEKTSDGMYLNLNDATIQFRQVTEVPYSSGNEYTLQISINNRIYTTTLEPGGAQTFNPVYDSSITAELVEVSFNNEPSKIGLELEITANSTFTINWIKLERGSSATPFTPNSYDQELAACKRYYQKIQSLGTFLYKYLAEARVGVQFDTMAHIPSNITITAIEIYVGYNDKASINLEKLPTPTSVTKNYFIVGISYGGIDGSNTYAAIITTTLDTEFDA